jgi:hypothetical protein
MDAPLQAFDSIGKFTHRGIVALFGPSCTDDLPQQHILISFYSLEKTQDWGKTRHFFIFGSYIYFNRDISSGKSGLTGHHMSPYVTKRSGDFHPARLNERLETGIFASKKKL